MAKSTGGVTLVLASLLMFLLVLFAYRSCSSGASSDSLADEAVIRANYEDSLQAAAEAAAYDAEVQARAEALMRAQTQPPLGDSLVRDPSLRREIVRERYTPLYVCVDFANVRSGPGLNHGKIDRLSLYDEVEFMGEKTDSTYRIDLGEVTPDAPWVKVRTESGKEGWIYGACVHYYKYRLAGVATD
ncbi:MAG: SH3 domain-containing protein [Bacteroidota bacterium]